MKQLLILSGKGGTGKTTVAGAFIKLSEAKACADCDVDAPNLHLLMERASAPSSDDYYGLPKALLDNDLCIRCGRCRQLCRFGAISSGADYSIDPFACEGCGVCEAVCPAGAIAMHPAVAGDLMLFSDDGGVFSTAQLRMGSGTSGKLVSEVKRRMSFSADRQTPLAIIDGSPGIGCPVIASMSGVTMVLIVAEPTLSGISDLERIVKTAAIFQTKAAVCINKYDISLRNCQTIEAFCRSKGLPLAGKIPFDPEAVRAVNSGRTVVETDCAAGRAVGRVYENVMRLLCDEA